MSIIKSVGSVCSGIEAASVAWKSLGLSFKWFSEISDFSSKILLNHYPDIRNIGDMNNIPNKILNHEIDSPDLICGGTPCQAFSLAGMQNGLNDRRGNLTLKFVDIINANDKIRLGQGKNRTVVFWENVEGVLTDKTNAFGCFISALAGLDFALENKKWPNSGFISGSIRNVAWRVLDAKFFGLPQQRKRLYVLAGDKNFHPENILFEINKKVLNVFPSFELSFTKDGYSYEIFRSYTDCLYAAYGTKWNGNAAATNGSLFIVQDNRIRRLSPLETERLMGFPDDYTLLPSAKKTNRYQAIGNSWAVPVIQWIGKRLLHMNLPKLNFNSLIVNKSNLVQKINDETFLITLGKDLIDVHADLRLNGTYTPEECTFTSIKDIVSPYLSDDLYISPVGCHGIIRRKQERNLKINLRLEEVLLETSAKMSQEDIEKKSRSQKRGKFSTNTIF